MKSPNFFFCQNPILPKPKAPQPAVAAGTAVPRPMARAASDSNVAAASVGTPGRRAEMGLRDVAFFQWEIPRYDIILARLQ